MVKEWIGIGDVRTDLEMRLNDVYPSDKALRNRAMSVIRYLWENGETPQKEMAEELFGPEERDAMRASRMLQRLEDFGLIERERRGMGKVVKMALGGR